MGMRGEEMGREESLIIEDPSSNLAEGGKTVSLEVSENASGDDRESIGRG